MRSTLYSILVASACFSAADLHGQESISHRRIPRSVANSVALDNEIERIASEELRYQKMLREARSVLNQHQQPRFEPALDIDSPELEPGQGSRSPRRRGQLKNQVLDQVQDLVDSITRQLTKSSIKDIPPAVLDHNVPGDQIRESGSQPERRAPDEPTNRPKRGFNQGRDSNSLAPLQQQIESWERQIKAMELTRQQLQTRSSQRTATPAPPTPKAEDSTDFVPHRDLLRAVRPYMNMSLVNELRNAYQTSSMEQTLRRKQPPSSSTPPPVLTRKPRTSSLTELTSENGRVKNNSNAKATSPGAIVDSLIKSIDKKGTDWLRSAQQRDKSKGNASFWKRFKNTSKSKFSKINRALTTRSTEIAKRRSQTTPIQFSQEFSRQGESSDSGILLPIAVLAVVLATGAVVWRRMPRPTTSLSTERPTVTDQTIRDSDSLLSACHQLTRRALGDSSCYWNHHIVFARLAEITGERHSVRELSSVYERARYAPEGRRLSGADLRYAQELYREVSCRAAGVA